MRAARIARALRAHLQLESGRYDVVFDYLDHGSDGDYELVSLADASGAVSVETAARREALCTGTIRGEREMVAWLVELALDTLCDEPWPHEASLFARPVPTHELDAWGAR